MDNFERALDFVLAREGGYSNDPNDPGGETRYGICKRYHPDLDIKNLTIAQAGEIYRKQYWEPNWCDQLPYWAALCVFDTAVNMGRQHAVTYLQKVCGQAGDGKLRPELTRIIRTIEPTEGTADFLSYRMARYTALPGWARFGRGWTRRCIFLAMEVADAATDAGARPVA